MVSVKAYAVEQAGGELIPFEYELPELGPDDVDIAVESCGICHSDLSMADNEWGITQYPFVGGHEVIGRVVDLGSRVTRVQVGQRVGLGWSARSCMSCGQCLGSYHQLCADVTGTITHQYGGFADRVRCHWGWATPIPESLDPDKCGPLMCGGITVFNPLKIHNISPTARVAVIGIGGLGHLGLLFANAWGCEVTAISRSRDKEEEARELGAHHYLATGEAGCMDSFQGHFDLIINTTNVNLPWDEYVALLAPRGTLHCVGAAPKVEAALFPMILGQKSISASPTGSIVDTREMIDFAARHSIEPVTETFEFSEINTAFEKLRHGSPRYRLVLKH